MITSVSMAKLYQCDPKLRKLIVKLGEQMDILVICGYRGPIEQARAVKEGKSKLKFPNSKHNKAPSLAVDIAPLPLNWNDIPAFNKMLDLLEKIAKEEKIKIRLGRTFSFKDYPHVELA